MNIPSRASFEATSITQKIMDAIYEGSTNSRDSAELLRQRIQTILREELERMEISNSLS